MKQVLQNIKLYCYYCLGRILAFFAYEKKYVTGKHFARKGGGWIWVIRCFPFQKIFRINSSVPWPVMPTINIGNWRNIEFDLDDMQMFHTGGTYFQGIDAKIIIGKGTWIAPNVGLITANHDLIDLDHHTTGQDIRIGEKCWIGMNAVILPGVVLGPHTVVGAGAIVTRSFAEGYCVIGGVPAKKIKDLTDEKKFEREL